MTIRVTCPNGHALKVKDGFAGKVGLCPKCKAQIQVPRLDNGDMSEDDIADILGGPDVPEAARPRKEAPRPVALPRQERAVPQGKTCHSCNEEIAASIHICPHCHTYIAKLADF